MGDKDFEIPSINEHELRVVLSCVLVVWCVCVCGVCVCICVVWCVCVYLCGVCGVCVYMCVTCHSGYRHVKTVFLFLKVHEFVVAALVNYMIA